MREFQTQVWLDTLCILALPNLLPLPWDYPHSSPLLFPKTCMKVTRSPLPRHSLTRVGLKPTLLPPDGPPSRSHPNPR